MDSALTVVQHQAELNSRNEKISQHSPSTSTVLQMQWQVSGGLPEHLSNEASQAPEVIQAPSAAPWAMALLL
jgi:hypothetical protein